MPYGELDEDEREEANRLVRESGIDESIERSGLGASRVEDDTLSEVDRAIDSLAREQSPGPTPRAAREEPEPIRFSEPIRVALETEAAAPPPSPETRDEASRLIESTGADRTIDQMSRMHPASAPELPQASAVLAQARGEEPSAPLPLASEASRTSAAAPEPRDADPEAIALEQMTIAAGAPEGEPSDGAPQPIRLEPMTITPGAPDEAGPEDRALASLAEISPATITSSPGFRMPDVDTEMLAGGEREGPAPSADSAAEDAAVASLAGREAPVAAQGTPATPAAPRRAPEGMAAVGPAARGEPARPATPGAPTAEQAADSRIPDEGDISDARLRDVLLRGPLAALAGFLTRGRAQIGPGEAQRLTEQRTRMLGEQRQSRADDLRAQELAAQQARASRVEAREGEELGLRREQAERAGREIDARLGLVAAQTARQEAETGNAAELQRQRNDSDSELSQSYQTTMQQRIDTYRATGQTGLADSLARLYPPSRLASMSARELEMPLSQHGGLPQVHMRGRAGGGAGGGAAADARRRGTSAVAATDVQRFVDANLITQEAAAGLAEQMNSTDRRTRDSAQQEINRLNARMPDSGATRVLIPGVRAGGHVDDVQARAYANTLTSTRAALEALQVYEDVYNRHGRMGTFSPQARAEMEAAHDGLVSMVARIRNTGVISPTEMPTIDEALPNPTSITQAALGTFPTRLRAYRDSLERNVTAVMQAAGVDETGQGTALEYARSYPRGGASSGGAQPAGRAPREGEARPAAAPTSGRRIAVIIPGHGRQTVPEENLEALTRRFPGTRRE